MTREPKPPQQFRNPRIYIRLYKGMGFSVGVPWWVALIWIIGGLLLAALAGHR